MPVSLTGFGDSVPQISPISCYRFMFVDGLVDKETLTIYEHSQVGIYSIPAFISFFGFDIQAATGFPHISVGTNDPDFNNVISDLNLSELKVQNDTLTKVVPTKTNPIPWDAPLTLIIKSNGSADAYIFCASLFCFPIF